MNIHEQVSPTSKDNKFQYFLNRNVMPFRKIIDLVFFFVILLHKNYKLIIVRQFFFKDFS